MKYSELKKLLRKNDCFLLKEGKRHELWKSSKTGEVFPVGRHDSQDVPAGTLKSILNSAGIQ
jgi:mRNA interferase HicA